MYYQELVKERVSTALRDAEGRRNYAIIKKQRRQLAKQSLLNLICRMGLSTTC